MNWNVLKWRHSFHIQHAIVQFPEPIRTESLNTHYVLSTVLTIKIKKFILKLKQHTNKQLLTINFTQKTVIQQPTTDTTMLKDL